MVVEDLASRLDRLESEATIRQLVARYAVALDARDIAELASLFVPDVRVGDGRIGRQALANWFDSILRPYRITFHLLGNHVITHESADRASGTVYCRPEHEVDDEWIVMPMLYWDRYERVDGAWLFRSRSPHVFYAADVRESPLASDGRFHFPGNPLISRADLPERLSTWQSYWATGIGQSPENGRNG